MGKIYYLMGKSASGKDHIYEHLIQETALDLKPFVLYTTRPIRSGEQDGSERKTQPLYGQQRLYRRV